MRGILVRTGKSFTDQLFQEAVVHSMVTLGAGNHRAQRSGACALQTSAIAVGESGSVGVADLADVNFVL